MQEDLLTSIKSVTNTVESISDFFKALFLPPVAEFGFLLKDLVYQWRLNNIYNIVNKSKTKFELFLSNDGVVTFSLKANPKAIMGIIENGSFENDEYLQNLWAGLLVSSCSESGNDDYTIIFANILKQLSSTQAKILSYSCKQAKIFLNKSGLLGSDICFVDINELSKWLGVNDLHRIQAEIEHLRALRLMVENPITFREIQESDIEITPTVLGLSLYAKCEGSIKSVSEYWRDSIVPYQNILDKSDNEVKALTDKILKESGIGL